MALRMTTDDCRKMTDELSEKASSATKWSLVTEAAVKLVAPLTQIALAHILAPEAFGVVATVTMVTSFADMLSDAGFQKYLIQHEFKDKRSLFRSANVAFLTNLFVSLVLWALVGAFNEPLAALVGNDGLGIVLVVACISLPVAALSSIQLALFHRTFAFKELFAVRVVVALVPLVVTVPLALFGLDFWSLVIGTIAGNFVNATALTVKSDWKPSFFYSLAELKEMISFSAWTLLEQFSIWLTAWMGTFIVGSLLTSYYLGLYKTSISMVNAGMGIITSATTPVLFAELSRRQADERAFQDAFFRTQEKVALFVVPLGFGIFLYRDFVTCLVLGPQWSEASMMFGLWALSGAVVIPIGYYASEVFRAKGRPRLSFASQVAYLLIMAPATYYAATLDFASFAICSSTLRLVAIAIDVSILKFFIRFPVGRMLAKLAPIFLCSVAMFVAGAFALRIGMPVFLGIIACVIVYALCCWCFPSTRVMLTGLFAKFPGKRRK